MVKMSVQFNNIDCNWKVPIVCDKQYVESGLFNYLPFVFKKKRENILSQDYITEIINLMYIP